MGGLLSIRNATDSATYYPTYDGNGDVSEYLDEQGDVVAHYEYDSFGNLTHSTGAQANQFTYRFSTKYLDSETNLYYYGYRFYNPETGRWPNRDPIEEEGGLSLFAFVGNNGINSSDFLGLDYILVADRRVRLTPGAFHTALENWEGCCPPKEKELDIAKYKKGVNYPGTTPGGFVEKDKIELLNTGGYSAWHWVSTDTSSSTTSRWVYRELGISVINYGFPSGSRKSSSAANIYDDTGRDVSAKWREITTKAERYRFAEQDGFTSFQHFPFSAYPELGLGMNSNTFVREMVSQAGLSMKEIGGLHPGPDSLNQHEIRFAFIANPNQPKNKPVGVPAKPTFIP